MSANLSSTHDSRNTAPNCQLRAVDSDELHEIVGGYLYSPTVYPMPDRSVACGTMILINRSWPFPK